MTEEKGICPSPFSWAVLDPANPKKLQTKILTVWRTLNVEIDQTKNAAGEEAGLPSLEGIPNDQFRRACIELKPYDQPSGSVTISPLEGIHSIPGPLEMFDPAPKCAADFDAVSDKRAIDPPTKDFWTVHLVGTFYGSMTKCVGKKR